MLDFSIKLRHYTCYFIKIVDVRFLYQAKTIYLFLDGFLDTFMKTADVRFFYQAETIYLVS